MSGTIHEWDGAYVLGALEPAERLRYEDHLTMCSACSRSVRELAGLPGVLGRSENPEALREPTEDGLLGAEHRVALAAGAARRLRRRRRRIRLTGAAVLLAVLAVLGGWAAAQVVAPSPSAASAHELEPVGGSHLSASLTATRAAWGTRLAWSCDYARTSGPSRTYAPAPTSYSLVVHTAGGASSVVATWTSEGGEAHGLVASTAVPADAIASVDIRVTGSSRALAIARF